jgi:hypothetical protein
MRSALTPEGFDTLDLKEALTAFQFATFEPGRIELCHRGRIK